MVVTYLAVALRCVLLAQHKSMIQDADRRLSCVAAAYVNQTPTVILQQHLALQVCEFYWIVPDLEGALSAFR